MRAPATLALCAAISAFAAPAAAAPTSSRPPSASGSTLTSTGALTQTNPIDGDPREFRVSDATRLRFDVGTSRVRFFVRWDF
jgi:hypothetical protein